MEGEKSAALALFVQCRKLAVLNQARGHKKRFVVYNENTRLERRFCNVTAQHTFTRKINLFTCNLFNGVLLNDAE